MDGELFVGSGFGARGAGGEETEDIARRLAETPAAVWAFCIEGQEGCVDAGTTPTP